MTRVFAWIRPLLLVFAAVTILLLAAIVLPTALIPDSLPLIYAQGEDDSTIYLPLTGRRFAAEVRLFGRVFLATDPRRQGIPGVEVCVVLPGVCATSDSNGNYSMLVPADGWQVLQVSPLTAPNDYYSLSRDIFIEHHTNEVDVPLVARLPAGNFAIVLSWKKNINGATNDLDAYLWLPPTFPYLVTNYRSEDCIDLQNIGTGSGTSFPFAWITNDSVDGVLPETIIITEAQDGEYTYVARHMDLASGNTVKPPFTATGAHVEFYDSAGLLTSMVVPVTGDPQSVWWKLFTVNFSGGSPTINRVNSLGLRYPVTGYSCLYE